MAEHISLEGYTRLTVDDLNQDGCINLIEFFLKIIGLEFEHNYTLYKKYPNDANYICSYNNTRSFILSTYFSNLTGLNGAGLLESLERRYNAILAKEAC